MRTITQAAAAILSGRNVPVTLLVELALTQTVYLNLSSVTINYDGHDWLGAGSLGAIEEINEAAGDYSGLKLSLSGVPSDMLSIALEEQIRNKVVTLSLALFDPDTHAVEDVYQVWSGRLDTMQITQSQGSCVIAATAEPAAVEFARPKPLRYTDTDQKTIDADDTSLRFIVRQAQHNDVWPAASWYKNQ